MYGACVYIYSTSIFRKLLFIPFIVQHGCCLNCAIQVNTKSIMKGRGMAQPDRCEKQKAGKEGVYIIEKMGHRTNQGRGEIS